MDNTLKAIVEPYVIYIGQGSTKSSTAQYARVYGTEANSGTYTPTDVVYVSVEGNRANRKPLDTVELQKALDAKAFNHCRQAIRQKPPI